MSLFCLCTKSNQNNIKDDILDKSIHNGSILNKNNDDTVEDTVEDKNEKCNIFSFFNIFCWGNK